MSTVEDVYNRASSPISFAEPELPPGTNMPSTPTRRSDSTLGDDTDSVHFSTDSVGHTARKRSHADLVQYASYISTAKRLKTSSQEKVEEFAKVSETDTISRIINSFRSFQPDNNLFGWLPAVLRLRKSCKSLSHRFGRSPHQ